MFGWLPVLLWILIGGVFFGAVQDFAAMYASVKNKGRTIGYIIEEYIGKLGKKLFLLFCWLFCILVVAAFADVVAGTFNGFVTADGVTSTVEANGAVATTSMLFIIEAVALGMILKYGRLGRHCNRNAGGGRGNRSLLPDLHNKANLAYYYLYLCADRFGSASVEPVTAKGLFKQLSACIYDSRSDCRRVYLQSFL